MPVKIQINEQAVAAKVYGAWKKSLPFLTNEIRADCNDYCKEDTGMLIASSLTHSRLQEGRIIWSTPYAARQYWEIRTAHKTINPRATWKWCEAAKRKNAKRWERLAQKALRDNL